MGAAGGGGETRSGLWLRRARQGDGGDTRSGLWLRRARRAAAARPAAASGCGGRGG